ncbi:MAG: hypothetical protein Q4G11_06640, partial [Gallicola sp.]|nr:hypothetical protein [Gallicola sp.]
WRFSEENSPTIQFYPSRHGESHVSSSTEPKKSIRKRGGGFMKNRETIKIYDSLTEIDNRFIQEVEFQAVNSHALSLSKRLIIIAAIIALLLLGSIAMAYDAGLFDPWFQKPSTSPIETVRSALENQIDKEYTLNIRVYEIVIDQRATQKAIQMYSGSERAKYEGWSDDYLDCHMIVVHATYYVEYDHEKTYLMDGEMDRYFILIRNKETMEWTIWDNTTPGDPYL